MENYLKQYHIYETLKDQLKFQVQQRAGTKERFDSLLRCKKSKLSLFSKEKETEMKELEQKLAIYSAEIMEINNNMLESKIEEEQLSELWSNIHTMSEAKHIIKHGVKEIKIEDSNYYDGWGRYAITSFFTNANQKMINESDTI